MSRTSINCGSFLAEIIRDKERLVIHPGVSQYATGGISACGLASLNFARLVLNKEREGIQRAALLAEIASDAVSICSQWRDNLHLEVETIFAVPLFQTSMKLTNVYMDLHQDLEFASDNTSVAVITRPPEIITCAKSSSLRGWQAHLLANFAAHIFIPNDKWSTDPVDLTQAPLKSSITILTLRAQLSDLESRNQFLTSMTDRLEEEIDELQETCEKLKKIQSQSHNRSIPKIDVWTMWPGVPSGSLQQWNSVKKLKGKGHAEEKSTAIEFALNLQCKFEGEDRQLEQEHRALAATAQALFDCAICLDTFPMDYAARVVECNHLACRNCLRQHLLTTLHDHRFPIFCSICTDGDKNTLILDIGVSEKEYCIFEELCKKSAFVDRTEYQEAGIIACPVPRCNHIWWKSCQQTHSCDGSSELDHLMKQRGWKYCPGCKTSVQKESGCNHTTVC
ncbi:uncharacterized protein BT62DRAFT_983338 [Guyanagaster necrorhizus]|uniref:RING-type domain-containing protein n=1 Tax=Guyanagaster necrorhizus TaxID=856835 RepID=A0A9P7VFR8_9AGAR|nr:uncharacterized protein BT62DRAFT_983338 [Guyanagaster necrorhizus MCA 3950]KAG7439763.1 hypothetical protein BT62DRAFT_983338 [Guyanagaster necrorhizus MCA 3950]